MSERTITEDMIFECFAAAQKGADLESSAESFVDVEEYENRVMYPEFARWAKEAGYPEISKIFLKVAGEEKAHSVWMRELYQDMGEPSRGEDTARAIAALKEIRENCDRLLAMNPEGVIENALKVAIRVENREWKEIYPNLRDQAIAANNEKAAEVYQRVIDSEKQHAVWFQEALDSYQDARRATA
ncbi:MAG: hypothetical protein H6617_10380 [Bdellovibrionaceae bacterium]|nr:hypothetical protein [Bdellovibrionales bacterium]MCB9255076.1 hypothetical protein [Pseudobdellovibrionaceae bacterium]